MKERSEATKATSKAFEFGLTTLFALTFCPGLARFDRWLFFRVCDFAGPKLGSFVALGMTCAFVCISLPLYYFSIKSAIDLTNDEKERDPKFKAEKEEERKMSA